ncbi:MAG: phenylacetate--CoA ligase family protein [Asgard group archaeon]|nr:phenylacetate--CoA ligase family protein [Asgard group archaeon]
MNLDWFLSLIIKMKLKRLQRKLTKNDQEFVKKQIRKLNPRTINLSSKYFMVNCLKHTAKNSPYYRDKLTPLIKDLKIKNAFSIIQKLPYTTSHEISENSKQFIAVPKDEIVSVHFTYGTTGGKKTIYNSRHDMFIISYSYTLGFLQCDIDKSDVAQILYSFGIWALAENIQHALLDMGVVTLTTGNYVNFKEQQNYIEKFGVTTLFGTPSYIYNLAREIDLPEENKKLMKAILVGGEGLPEHRRKIIEERLGGQVFINYGLNEVGGGIGSECKCHNGYHIFPTNYVEIIDPKTGQPVKKGEYGELVVTTLRREAMPLIRYRTGDITREILGECECGLKLPRIDYLQGRADDRVIIGAAEKYYPITFDLVFDSIKEVKDYWIEIYAENGKDTLKVYVLTENPSDKLQKKIIDKFYSIDSMKIDIETTKTVAVPEIIFVTELPKGAKRRRLVDKRKIIK